MTWWARPDLWSGVAVVRPLPLNEHAGEGGAYVSFIVEADDRLKAARRLQLELAKQAWLLESFLNLQSAQDVPDDESREILDEMGKQAELEGVSFSSFQLFPKDPPIQ